MVFSLSEKKQLQMTEFKKGITNLTTFLLFKIGWMKPKKMDNRLFMILRIQT